MHCTIRHPSPCGKKRSRKINILRCILLAYYVPEYEESNSENLCIFRLGCYTCIQLSETNKNQDNLICNLQYIPAFKTYISVSFYLYHITISFLLYGSVKYDYVTRRGLPMFWSLFPIILTSYQYCLHKVQ